MGLFQRARPSRRPDVEQRPSAGILGLEAPDPLLGDWRVTYGSSTIVRISGGPAGYAITAVQWVKLARSRHSLPAGTLIGQIAWAGGRRYTGWHGLWWTDTGVFANPARITLTLDRKARRLSGVIDENSEKVTYRR